MKNNNTHLLQSRFEKENILEIKKTQLLLIFLFDIKNTLFANLSLTYSKLRDNCLRYTTEIEGYG